MTKSNPRPRLLDLGEESARGRTGRIVVERKLRAVIETNLIASPHVSAQHDHGQGQTERERRGEGRDVEMNAHG